MYACADVVFVVQNYKYYCYLVLSKVLHKSHEDRYHLYVALQCAHVPASG